MDLAAGALFAFEGALGVLVASDAHSLPDFSPIALHISEKLMRTLEEERLLYVGPVPEQVVLAKMRRDLPVVHARGVLKVQREQTGPCKCRSCSWQHHH